MRLLFFVATAAALDAVVDSKGQVLKKAPLLLQAKASLKRPEKQPQAPSFLQEEIFTEVVPLAAPHLPFQPHSVVQGQALPAWTWPCFIALAAVALALCSRRPTDRLTSEVEQLPILPGAELSEAKGLVRLEGHVTLEAAALTAPFSEKKCVFYSASVSHPRHDEIRQPPLAFCTRATDFSLELQDAPHIRVRVSSDVSLFSMQTGQQEWQQAFMEAPKTWCSFVLSHLVSTDASARHFKKCLDLGSDGVALDFRESALLCGSHVTCVGQVVKDGGHWTLQAAPRSRWAVWQKQKDCLAGSVLISDHPRLHG